MGHFFGIDQIIIHNNYESYSTIASNLLKDYKGDILAEDNPDNHIVLHVPFATLFLVSQYAPPKSWLGKKVSSVAA